MISALPVIPSIGCDSIPGLSAVCGAASGVGSSILGAGASDVLGSIAGGVAQGASWLLGQIGTVMASTTSIDLGASWFKAHYEVMVGLAAVVLVPLLLASVIQAIYHQSASALLRTALVHLPLALLLGAVAVARFASGYLLCGPILNDRQTLRDLWLIPARDVVGAAIWFASFGGDTIVWRGERFHLKDGRLTRA